MYEQLFEMKLLTLAVMLASSALVGAVVCRASLGLRSLVYSFVPSISLAFYVIGLIGPARLDTLDLIAGLFFELLVLAIFVRLFADVHKLTHCLGMADVRRALLWSMPIQLLLGAPLMSLENFGIFADGSRIGYLGEAAWAKYLTYASILLSAIQAPLLARLVTLRGSVPPLAWGVVLLNAANSTLSGSKGAVFLWILAIAALIDWREARLRWATVLGFAAVTTVGLVASVWFLSSVTGMEPDEFIGLAFGRFIVTNDARALAFDMRSEASGTQGVLRESLRSLSGLLGFAPKRDPLGVLLYQELFGPAADSGANGSLMALATYYMPRGSALLPAVVASTVLLLLTGAARWLVQTLGTGLGALIVSAAALVCVGLYSQDFLAFQLAAPMGVLLALAIVALRWLRSRRRVAPAFSH